MALDSNRLGDSILAALDALNPDAGTIPAPIQAHRRAAMRAMAEAIVTEIKDHADVHVSATVAAAIPVQVNTGTGTGATTATGTATTTTGTIV